jgi:hypothetical protein
MDKQTTTINGIVKAVKKDLKGLALEDPTNPKGKWYSNNYFQGQLNCKRGDEVELTLQQNGQYQNLIACKVLKSSAPMAEARESKSVEMLTAYAKDLVVAAMQNNKDLDVTAAMKIASTAVLGGYKAIKEGLNDNGQRSESTTPDKVL